MYQNIQQILKYQDAEIFTYDCDSIIFKFNDSIPIPLQEHNHIFGYFKSEIPKGYFLFYILISDSALKMEKRRIFFSIFRANNDL